MPQPTRTFKDATPYLNDPALLREKADRDGYLFIKGLLTPAVVLGVRRDILVILHKWNLLNKDKYLMEGIGDLEAIHNLMGRGDANYNDTGVPMEIYREIQRLESFHALAHDPRLLQMYEALFGEKPFLYPQKVGRINLLNSGMEKSRENLLHSHNTGQIWTGWMALGSFSQETGAPAVLEGSEWVSGNVNAGDFLTFRSHSVYKEPFNQQPDHIQLSAGVFFQPSSAPIDKKLLMPHGAYGWDDVYADWRRKDLTYYWEKQDGQ